MRTQFGTAVRHAVVLLLPALALAGCTMFQGAPYEERYEVTRLTVVLMDEDSIRKKWEEISRKSPVRVVTIGPEQTTHVRTVRGFYDYNTHTIYCPRMNAEVCGHELFHAIFGKFHPEQ